MYPDKVFLGMSFYEIFLTLGILAVLLFADRACVKRGFSVALQRGVIVFLWPKRAMM